VLTAGRILAAARNAHSRENTAWGPIHQAARP
jgi:hypothetical protein